MSLGSFGGYFILLMKSSVHSKRKLWPRYQSRQQSRYLLRFRTIKEYSTNMYNKAVIYLSLRISRLSAPVNTQYLLPKAAYAIMR